MMCLFPEDRGLSRTPYPNNHEVFMGDALKEAIKAFKRGEVPVGCVIVRDGEVIGRGYNRREASGDPTDHAEIIAIREASKRLGDWRLIGSVIYVTLEPCIMCMGAILQARISTLVFSTFDPKAGASGSLYNLSQDKRLNHSVQVVSGIMKEESERLLKDFFKGLREADGYV